MRALLAILVILTAWPCEAQVRRRALGPRRSGGNNFPLPPNIAFRWIGTNQPNSISKWTDIIAGYSWTNSANFPSTNNNGVYFDGSTFLYATNDTYNATNAQLVVVKFLSVGDSYHFAIDGTMYLGITTAGEWRCRGTHGTVEQGKIYDYLITAGSAGYAITSGTHFTNGVEMVNLLSMDGYSINGVGGVLSGFGMNGILYEFVVWTNVSSWTLNDVTNIHRYCTNTYKFSP